jgi:hypothetical protein
MGLDLVPPLINLLNLNEKTESGGRFSAGRGRPLLMGPVYPSFRIE